MDVSRRAASLSHDPAARVASLAELVGIAQAIEVEAIGRYRRLAEEMRRRDETATAEAFETLAEEELRHVDAVAGWAGALGEAVPPAEEFRWRLPADLAESWEEVLGSALLTPYRALAIAVDNEERAFAFYSFLAAASPDPKVAREAEHLAAEELHHAARLRVWRRAAWRRENPDGGTGSAGPWRPETVEALAGLLATQEAEIAGCHGRLAGRLREAGDPVSATLLDELASEAAGRAETSQPVACTAPDCESDRPLALLLAAQRPLEQLCEHLEELHLNAPSEALQTMAQAFLGDAVARTARLGRRIEQLDAR
ncbi:MAG: ferritin family protein [Tistlia sp.]|uniref:ferritin family protein n=1 Tax=Tistlia sp. TaxID=3057121 RepID=UPI0034A4478B